MVAELLTSERSSKRFSRYRATQRVMHHMPPTGVYGGKLVPEQDLRLVSERGSKTDGMKEDIKRRRMRRKQE